jgi:hypothetical protein
LPAQPFICNRHTLRASKHRRLTAVNVHAVSVGIAPTNESFRLINSLTALAALEDGEQSVDHDGGITDLESRSVIRDSSRPVQTRR